MKTTPQVSHNLPHIRLSNGTFLRVSSILDVDGDVLDEMPDDPSEVHYVVAQLPNGRWLTQEVGPDIWKPMTAGEQHGQ